MRVKFLILFLFILASFLFSLELTDITRNHQYRDQVYYLAENNFMPQYIDSTFQLDSELTVFQVALSLIFVNAVSLNVDREEPYLLEFGKSSIEYPYVQYLFNKEIVKKDIDVYATCNVSEALYMFSKMYPDVKFSLDKKEGPAPFLRRDFLVLITKIDQFNRTVSRYRADKRKKEDEYVGSAVSEYILGYASALDRIELSKYSSGNRDYYDVFWMFASEKDKQYQKFNEDLSLEDLDLLDKRLNQALLNFYNFKYWLVIQQCNIVLKEDPKNVGALKLKGSTYYMLRDFDKARKYWEKVLYYQPNNEEMRYFLKVLPRFSE